ncbi:hypothetical protein XENORESO_018391 [Xenotaenia resolanae]|uniref:Uncharacterized protein n=1 Tax=Xenotaenia resolanae TaxID=208358 RepID=A0ABV0WA71_9TELE
MHLKKTFGKNLKKLIKKKERKKSICRIIQDDVSSLSLNGHLQRSPSVEKFSGAAISSLASECSRNQSCSHSRLVLKAEGTTHRSAGNVLPSLPPCSLFVILGPNQPFHHSSLLLH